MLKDTKKKKLKNYITMKNRYIEYENESIAKHGPEKY